MENIMKGLSHMAKTNIEAKAIELMEKVNYVDDSDAIDVIQIAKKAGFAVGNAVLDDEEDGFIIVKEGAKEILGIHTDKLIGVNSARTLEWKRFIIAHELAHYVLHYGSENHNGMYAHREHKKGKSVAENDADFFAANLLMPRKKFLNTYNELKNKKLDFDEIVILLSSKFVVTSKTVERRIEELGLKLNV